MAALEFWGGLFCAQRRKGRKNHKADQTEKKLTDCEEQNAPKYKETCEDVKKWRNFNAHAAPLF